MTVFTDDEDRQRYLQMALECSSNREVQVHAYVLMGNHAHLLVVSGSRDLPPRPVDEKKQARGKKSKKS